MESLAESFKVIRFSVQADVEDFWSRTIEQHADPCGVPLTSSMELRPVAQQTTAARQRAGGGRGHDVRATKSGQVSDMSSRTNYIQRRDVNGRVSFLGPQIR
jgi:hypothetical protein